MKVLSTVCHDTFPAWVFPDWALNEVRIRFPECQISKVDSKSQILKEIVDADIVLASKLEEAHIIGAERLKWVHAATSGVEGVLTPSLLKNEVILTNSKGVHAIPVSEHVIALILAFARRLPECLEDQRLQTCRRAEHYLSMPSFRELCGMTIGIVGIGAVGSMISQRAAAFGMRVIGFRQNESPIPPLFDSMHSSRELDRVLPMLDYFVLAAPLTSETRSMIGTRQFALMKRSAILINIARGELVDQDALFDALNSGQIAGAGIDVAVPDPLPNGHPFYTAANLIVTSHTAGVSPMLWRRILDLWMDNIERFLAGRALVNRVWEKNRGY